MIIRTTDGGLTWNRQSSGTTGRLFGVYFTDANNGTAVGEHVILRTTDGGSTWVNQPYPPAYRFDYLLGVFFTNAATGTVVGAYGRILRTTDGGTTWTDQSSGTVNDLGGVYFINADTGAVVGGGSILHTTDGGATWTSQSTGTTDGFSAVYFANADTGTIAGSRIFRTTDGGSTWVSQPIETNNNLNGISFTDANTGTAVGDNGTILRTTTGGITGIKNYAKSNVNSPKTFLLEQNYPNPFNPSTVIDYSVPRNGFVTLRIYNILGQGVATLLSGMRIPGQYQATFDASRFASGVYFYRLQAGSYTMTKKMLLMK